MLARVDVFLLQFSEHEVVFVVFLQHDLEHVVEQAILFVRFSHCCAWLQVGRFVLDLVGHGVEYQLSSECNQRLATRGVELILEVAEGVLRDLHVPEHEVARDARMELVQVTAEYHVVLSLQEQVV